MAKRLGGCELYIVLTGFLAMAVLADLAKAKISNRLILYGLVVCLLLQLIYNGPPGLIKGSTNALLTFVLLYILFLVGALGAGDIKLLCVMASVLGAKESILILFISGLILMACKFSFLFIRMVTKNDVSFGFLEKDVDRRVFVIFGKGYSFTRVKFSPFIFVSYLLLTLWHIV